MSDFKGFFCIMFLIGYRGLTTVALFLERQRLDSWCLMVGTACLRVEISRGVAGNSPLVIIESGIFLQYAALMILNASMWQLSVVLSKIILR